MNETYMLAWAHLTLNECRGRGIALQKLAYRAATYRTEHLEEAFASTHREERCRVRDDVCMLVAVNA